MSDKTKLLVATMAALLGAVVPTAAQAAPSAEKVCADVAKKAGRTLWGSVRESGDDLFCRKSWVPGLPDELAACGLWTKTNVFSNKLKNLWNRSFAAAGSGWATWGARGMGPDWEEGTIRGGFKRTFFGAGLAYTTSTFEVVKEGGRAEANLTACVLDYDGKVVETRRKSFDNGKGGEGTAVKFVLPHEDNRIVALVVDTPASVNSFEYRARQLTVPSRINTAEVKGVADLHVHQLVSLAFGGRLYWGNHSGAVETALAKEEVNFFGSGFDLTSVDGLVKALAQPGAQLDANLLFAIAGGKKSDEGFWKYGGAGHPGYEDWPHHADRSHQQVHISWLKEAHERGADRGANLNLVVVSLVNNDILCSVAKTVDPYGNVPTRNAAGKITGWESASWGCSDRENVMRQLKALHDLERANPWYRIAMTPWHARQIIADGDLAVVVSMETDKPLSGEGNNYGSWEDQLDFYRAQGLTTLQVVHESNSRFCGAALHRDMMGALQLIHWPLKSLDDLFTTKFEVDSNQHNKLGLTKEGEKLVDAMAKRSMPIDLAHGSQRCREGILKRLGTGYSFYDSHTKFGRLLSGHVAQREQEFVLLEGLLPLYKQHKVLVGLRTGSVDIEDAPLRAGAKPNARVANNCPGSARSFAQLVHYAHDQGLDFAYGTDFNTGVSQLGPRYGEGRCWAARDDLKDTIRRRASVTEGALPARFREVKPIAGTNYYTHGLATIGWLPELTIDLVEHLKVPGGEKLKKSAEAYLRMWERAYPPEDAPAGSTTARVEKQAGVAPGSVGLGGSCSAGDQCQSGRCTGVAGAKGVCVCNEDGDCAKGQFCDAGADLKQNACRAKRANDEPCALAGGGHQCQSGQCKLGRCYAPGSVAFGGVCFVDDACKQGRCSSVGGTKGTCVCDKDGDCGSGHWCDRGADLKKNVCKAKLGRGELCGTAGELGVGHRCKSGKCKLKGVGPKLECK